MLPNGEAVFNFGDGLQSLATELLLEQVGAAPTEITQLHREKLNSYDGKIRTLPMCGYFGGKTSSGEYPYRSKSLNPVWISYKHTLPSLWRFPDNVVVGCRDAFVKQKLERNGTICYLSGCLSFTMPFTGVKGKEIMFIDAPESLQNFAPESILNKALHFTNEYAADFGIDRDLLYEYTKNRYRYIQNNACLVVTSRMHIAAPCLAWGIPVIFVRGNKVIDERQFCFRPFMPLYTPENFESIDWSPKAVDISSYKEMQIRAFIDALENGKKPSSVQLELDRFLSDYATTKRPITSLYYYPITYTPKLAIIIRKLFATKLLRRFTNLQSLPTRAPRIETRPEADIFKGAV
jgi:hypothetical protein